MTEPATPGVIGSMTSGTAASDPADRVLAVVRQALGAAGLAAAEPRLGTFVFDLPGEHKLATPCRLMVGDHTLAVHAFVCRNPDESHDAVYRWLLTRNLRLYGVAFAVDASGDIYLSGRVALTAVTVEELDRLLGAVLTYADESFNTILELGFATSIRKEWRWRMSRGESTRNLDAFRGWLESEELPPSR
jgi:Putative bacterial sensory transduction regulator